MQREGEGSPGYGAAGEAFSAIVIGQAEGDVARAIELAHGRIITVVGWPAASGALATAAPRPVLCVEAEGVDEDVLAAALPRIDGYAAALDLPVVVALSEAQIDIVTTHLLGRRVELLCAPTLVERIAALAVAARIGAAPTLDDSWRESEAQRLQRLNEEVARIADLLARLTRSEPSPGSDVEDRRQSFDAGPAFSVTIDPQEIRRTIRLRRLRDQFFAPGLFEDPGWDMLLDLFAAELEGSRVSVSSLCIAAAVAPTTALRWIGKMTDAGLFERQPDQHDRRRAFMALTPRASEAMHRYVAAAKRAEQGIA